jgi:hypothetical protein
MQPNTQPGPQQTPPRDRKENKSNDAPQREGGDDALNAEPNDSRLDEKVIVNEQRSDKVVNGSSQTNPFEEEGEKL